MRYFIELSYNGKAYHGWQVQPNAISVQEVLEKSLSTILRQPIAVVGAGRTDAGVHASQIFAHFDVEELPFMVDKLTYKLNAILPKDIAIKRVFRVHDEAHARFDATSRSYEYRVVLSKNVFDYEFTHYVRQSIDVDKMNAAANILLEYTDFQCFSKVKTDVFTYNCDVTEAVWKQQGDELVFFVSANRFLRNMVRAIVGTLLEIGQGKRQVSDMHEVLKSKSREQAGVSVPGHALYLTAVQYPKSIHYVG